MKASQALRGTWRITAPAQWSGGEPAPRQGARLTFGPRNRGSLRFRRVDCQLDCLYGEREGYASVAFSFAGTDGGDPVSGRGVAALVEGRVHGHIFFHLGANAVFAAERAAARRPRPSARRSSVRRKNRK